MSVEVVAAGARTSIERATRGRAHLGVSVGGPFDPRAALRANRLVGNRDDDAVLEMTLVGPTLRFLVAARIAIAGPLAIAGVHDVRAGDVVALGVCTRGVRASLAMEGGFAGAGLIAKGDVLAAAPTEGERARRAPPAWQLPDDIVLRVTDAPQCAGVIELLVARSWTVSPTSDRAGVRLEGDVLATTTDIVSAGVSVGAVQLPPSGKPVILGVDRATTGGYPVVAHVATVDRWLLGQLRPGAPVRFERVTFEQARALAIQARHEGF